MATQQTYMCGGGSCLPVDSCPMRMADGRTFTDYQPRCARNDGWQQLFGQQLNSYDLRQYLISNADQLMQANRTVASCGAQCAPCKTPWNKGTMLPESSMVKCNAQTCSIAAGDPFGLGQGRDYGIAQDAAFIEQQESLNNLRMRNQSAAHERCMAMAPPLPAHLRQSVPGAGSV